MTTTPDIEAIRKRAETAAKALDVGGISGAFLCVEPILNDIPALLSHIAAQDAERKVEIDNLAVTSARVNLSGEAFIEIRVGHSRDIEDLHSDAHTALRKLLANTVRRLMPKVAAYLAQKEKK